MKKVILLCGAVLAVGAAVLGVGQPTSRTLRCRWNPVPEEDVAGYRVYLVGSAGGQLIVDVGPATNVVISTTNTPPLRLWVTAYNSQGWESDPSDEVMIVWPSRPARPIVESVVTTIVTTTIETSP